ncbi:MAG: DAK2 domain-containing protein [Rikenellaceae bacterium]
MNKLTVSDFQKMIAAAASDIEARGEEFSKMDAALGDGDHGEAIVTAMKVIVEESKKGGSFKVLLGDMGFGVMMQTSGSTSSLLGGLLLGMSDGVPADVEELTFADVQSMFTSGLAGVQKNTKAQIGDKTMMDSLQPAVETLAADASGDIAVAMKAASEAALAGAASTCDMIAKFGRARNFGEKCIGHVDAGATSWAQMFVSFAQTIE